ncbi:unnamed protein product [Orchesella dallaii]|uniref:Uncharacterized protein n=1 Tax=Orchesella dallaii TaxID=48710 RepID=A0ABP1QAP9_9HEXA
MEEEALSVSQLGARLNDTTMPNETNGSNSLDAPQIDESLNPSHQNPIENSGDSSRGLPSSFDAEEEKFFNGFMLIGNTWNITSLDGYLCLPHAFEIKNEASINCKGFPEAIAAKYRYKIELGIVDNTTLGLLILSNSNTCKIMERETEAMESEMTSRLRQVILDSLKQLNCKSWIQYQASERSTITIYAIDWYKAGFVVAERLTDEGYLYTSVFPSDASFHFFLRRLGHESDCETFLNHNHYPHFQRRHVTRAIVHIAYDFHLDDHVLFFNDQFVSRANSNPTYKLPIAMIPTVNDYIYLQLPFNLENVASMHQHTCVFNPLNVE